MNHGPILRGDRRSLPGNSGRDRGYAGFNEIGQYRRIYADQYDEHG